MSVASTSKIFSDPYASNHNSMEKVGQIFQEEEYASATEIEVKRPSSATDPAVLGAFDEMIADLQAMRMNTASCPPPPVDEHKDGAEMEAFSLGSMSSPFILEPIYQETYDKALNELAILEANMCSLSKQEVADLDLDPAKHKSYRQYPLSPNVDMFMKTNITTLKLELGRLRTKYSATQSNEVLNKDLQIIQNRIMGYQEFAKLETQLFDADPIEVQFLNLDGTAALNLFDPNADLTQRREEADLITGLYSVYVDEVLDELHSFLSKSLTFRIRMKPRDIATLKA